MRYTNLELVQTILSSMDSDEVNSVSDTTESQQVLQILKTVYFNIAALGELPRDADVFQLNASIDSTKPVTMDLPDDVTSVDWIKYDAQTLDDPTVDYQNVIPMPLHDFIGMVSQFTEADDNVISYEHTIGSDTFTLYAKNDQAPQFYTTTNDDYILFDSYDAEVDTTLQKSKTMCFGQKSFPWSATDTFVPPLDEQQHQRLLHEAKALAWAELKQAQHASAEKSARQIQIIQQSSKRKVPTMTALQATPGYGRRVTGWTKPTGRYK